MLGVVGVIVAASLFMGAESKPSYQPLFTNLQSSDAGAITQQLSSQKIPYQLADGGSTILVPASDVDQERIALAQQGLPQAGNVGFSNLEKSGITTSEFVQQVEYQQALEGQLEQTISSIQGVQSAQVNLVVPQQSDFAVGTQQTTTASILVNLSPGTALSSGQVSAIVHLTASSVPGLSSSNVTVVDNHGDVLTAPGDAGGTSGASDTQQTDAYDNQLAASLTALLARVRRRGERRRPGQRPSRLQPEPDHHQRSPAERPGTAGDGHDRAVHIEQLVQRDRNAALGRPRLQPGTDHDRRERHVHDDQFPNHQRRRSGHPDGETGSGTGATDVRCRPAQLVQGQEGRPGSGPVPGDGCRRVEHGQRGPTRRDVHAVRSRRGTRSPPRSPPPRRRPSAARKWSTSAKSAACSS